MTNHQVSNEGSWKLPDSWKMNELIKRVEDDTDKVVLVDLWTSAYAMKRELDNLTKLIKSVHNPY